MKVNLEKKEWQFFTLFMLGLTWGSSFILMKQGLKSYTAVEVALYRLSFSFLFLFPFMIPQYRKIPKDRYPFIALAGILGNGIPAFMFAIALKHIPSAMGGILNATVPIFTLIVGAIFFSLAFRKNAVFGIAIGLAGTAYLLLSNMKSENTESNYLYALLPLLGSLCYGFSTNIIKKELKDIPAVSVTAGALTFVGPPSIAALLLMGALPKITSSPEHVQNILFIALLGIMGTSIAVIIFNFLIKEITVLFAASVTYIIPMFAMTWGLFLGETITIHYFIGIALILFGVYLTNR